MISILIPIYNGIEFIEEAINSIKDQTYKEWEVIIGINGHLSNSDVYQIAKEYENDKIKVYDLQNVKGKSEALNAMLQYSNYNWIALLDVDDKWLPNKLESQLPYLNHYDVIGTFCQYFGDKTDIMLMPPKNISNFDFLKINPIINSSVILKKELCWWDKNHEGVEDYDLWLRLWKQNKKFYNVPAIQILHRIHDYSAFNAKGNNEKVDTLREKYENNKIKVNNLQNVNGQSNVLNNMIYSFHICK